MAQKAISLITARKTGHFPVDISRLASPAKEQKDSLVNARIKNLFACISSKRNPPCGKKAGSTKSPRIHTRGLPWKKFTMLGWTFTRRL
jgi:hypothetical protein